MSAPAAPQLYLITPPVITLSRYADTLDTVLGSTDVACLRIALAETNEDALVQAADVLRDVAHRHEVAVVITDHFRLVDRLGLDGVHLSDGSRTVRDARKALGKDAIIGAYCEASRHTGMTAGENGADYISFGPVADTGAMGSGEVADKELFDWWSAMIELPVVAEGNISPQSAADLRDSVDFLCLGPEIWDHGDGPAAALAAYQPSVTV